MPKHRHVVIIADYGKGDPAFTEVNMRIRGLVPGGVAGIDNIAVDPFSTTQTGFWAAQVAQNWVDLRALKRQLDTSDTSRPVIDNDEPRLYVYLNTAPRRDNKAAREHNEGEKLIYARLARDIEVIGVNSGESFSFVREMAAEFRPVLVPANGSQFRSRDTFPVPLAAVMQERYEHNLGSTFPSSEIPDFARDRIGHIDGYGNLKLTTPHSEFTGVKEGGTVRVVIGGVEGYVTYHSGMFCIAEGQLCVAPGSSGPKGDPFLEISVRGGSAQQRFGNPAVESAVAFGK